MEQADFVDIEIVREVKRFFPEFKDIPKGAYPEEYAYCCIAFAAGFSYDFALRRIQYGEYPFLKDGKYIENRLNQYNFSPDFLFWLMGIYSKMNYAEGILLVERSLGKKSVKNEERFLL